MKSFEADLKGFYYQLMEVFGKQFKDFVSSHKSFTPELLLNALSAIQQVKMTKKPIPGWLEFEHSLTDFGTEDFKDLMFDRFIEGDEEYWLITDEGLMKEKVFHFNFSDLEEFMEWYENKFEMEFFQPADYILFRPKTNRFRILINDGYIFE